MTNLALPGHPRYQPKELVDVFGYDNLYRAVAEVEIAALKTLGDFKIIPQEDLDLLTPEVEAELLAIQTTDVDRVERMVTKHDIRAWVQIAQSKVRPELRRWIHVPLTSYDVLDTARALQFKQAHKVVDEMAHRVMGYLAEKVYETVQIPQIGRTHGQHALPITVGFWLATILNRIYTCSLALDTAAAQLVGKISGPVGAYNAQVGLGISECTAHQRFEEQVLQRLGLKPGRISTQIVQPEYLADYLFACIKLSAALGQFGRDARHLMRTEIRELGEPFDQHQVGSSTMAHKRNPINFENLESTWLKNKAEFQKVLDTMISEHQRDLVNSAISRDFPVIVVNLVSQLSTLLRPSSEGIPFIKRIGVDREACAANLQMQGDAIMAEPVYLALQMAGYEGDAHELVNHQALKRSEEWAVPLVVAVEGILCKESPDIAKKVFDRIGPEMLELLKSPQKYLGAAIPKAIAIAAEVDEYLKRCSPPQD